MTVFVCYFYYDYEGFSEVRAVFSRAEDAEKWRTDHEGSYSRPTVHEREVQ